MVASCFNNHTVVKTLSSSWHCHQTWSQLEYHPYPKTVLLGLVYCPLNIPFRNRPIKVKQWVGLENVVVVSCLITVDWILGQILPLSVDMELSPIYHLGISDLRFCLIPCFPVCFQKVFGSCNSKASRHSCSWRQAFRLAVFMSVDIFLIFRSGLSRTHARGVVLVPCLNMFTICHAKY